MHVPAIPVSRPDVGRAELDALAEVMCSGWLGTGDLSRRFEAAVARVVGARHVVAVTSCTDALILSLAAAGIGPGDEVLVPSFTYCATYQAIAAVGATPVFADIDAATLSLDPLDAEARVTERTRAVLAVHYCGSSAGRAAAAAFAGRLGIVLIEDAAHAFGSSIESDAALVGSTGNPVCLSFGPIKQLTCGTGGAVCVADEAFADRVRERAALGLRTQHGDSVPSRPPPAYVVDGLGVRRTMSDVNAAIGLAQLSGLDRRLRRRREIRDRYVAELGGRGGPDGTAAATGGAGLELIAAMAAVTSPFMFPVLVDAGRRDDIRAALHRRGIGAGLHYPPGHLQPAFAGGDALPVTETVASRVLTLPVYPTMTDANVQSVLDAVAEAVLSVRP